MQFLWKTVASWTHSIFWVRPLHPCSTCDCSPCPAGLRGRMLAWHLGFSLRWSCQFVDFLFLPGTGLAGSLGWLKCILDLINLSHRTWKVPPAPKPKRFNPHVQKDDLYFRLETSSDLTFLNSGGWLLVVLLHAWFNESKACISGCGPQSMQPHSHQMRGRWLVVSPWR